MIQKKAANLKTASDGRFIIVTGGVMSGSGKGITAAAIGAGLAARRLKINIQKFDMYLNVDAGLLNPGRHGEVFVTIDGGETDLDLGHYERFLDRPLSKANSVMQGLVVSEIIKKERRGGFDGEDVQVIPHVMTAIQDKMIALVAGFDVLIVELGGTVGDYESLAFLEAVRQLPNRVGRDNVFYVHLVYLPYLATSDEIKTKPAQNACRDIRSIGIIPDILIGRCERPVGAGLKRKLALTTGLTPAAIGIIPDARTVYEVPMMLEAEAVTPTIAAWLGHRRRPNMSRWRRIKRQALTDYKLKVRVALVAKYLTNKDTYLSVTEALQAAAWVNRVNLEIVWLDAERINDLTESAAVLELLEFDGIVVPGGFGQRGVDGMIRAAAFSLTNNTPYLGICLGMQIGVIAQARLGADLPRANSAEFSRQRSQLVIDYMPGQRGKDLTGSSMRLGGYPCRLRKATKVGRLYGDQRTIKRRHRHRFEFNPDYQAALVASGLVIAGVCPDNNLVEIIEIKDCDFFVGCQFHPEFESRPHQPEPLFVGFLAAVRARRKSTHGF